MIEQYLKLLWTFHLLILVVTSFLTCNFEKLMLHVLLLLTGWLPHQCPQEKILNWPSGHLYITLCIWLVSIKSKIVHLQRLIHQSKYRIFKPWIKYQTLNIKPWIKLFWHSCSIWDKPGWFNWFLQFLCERLSSFHSKGF